MPLPLALMNDSLSLVEPSRPRAPIRPAATLILLRDTPQGPEVFMQRRSPGAAFLGGAYVFPGGALEAADADPQVLQRVTGLTDAEASARLALPAGALAYWVAAARECFEEAGILLAHDEAGAPAAPERVAALAPQREALNRGALAFVDLLGEHRLRLPADELVYFDHWITPPVRPRRFDTRFFVARAPQGQEGSHDDGEAVHSVWLRPAEALERGERSEMDIAFATRFMLRELARFATVDEAIAHARAKGPIESNRPVVAQGAAGQRIFRRGDAAYAEIHWSDPDETTQTTYDLAPGVPKRLDRFVTRVIAPNPGRMTGPGTNTYLVGGDELAVIDPGPALDAHVDAILACGGSRIRWILCTHTHRDHSPAARALQAATGAQVIGLPAPAGASQDEGFAPDRQPARDERLAIAGVTLRALHTPGHASNHVLLPARGDADAVLRRSRDAGLDGGHQSAGRRHARLRRVAGSPAGGGHRDHRAGPRLPRRHAAARDPAPDPPPRLARSEGARARCRATAARPARSSCPTSTRKCRRGCTASPPGRCSRTSTSSSPTDACARTTTGDTSSSCPDADAHPARCPDPRRAGDAADDRQRRQLCRGGARGATWSRAR